MAFAAFSQAHTITLSNVTVTPSGSYTGTGATYSFAVSYPGTHTEEWDLSADPTNW